MLMNELFHKIQKDKTVIVPPAPATGEMLQELETKLGARLPEDYLTFMKAFNGGEHRFARLYSIGVPPWEMLEQWQGYRERIPAIKEGKFLPFGDDYSGAPFCFDMRGADNDRPVVIWDSWLSADDEPERRAETFLDFAAAEYDESKESNVREVILKSITRLKPGERIEIGQMQDFNLQLEVLPPLSTVSEEERSSAGNSSFMQAIFGEPEKLFAFMLIEPEARLKMDITSIELVDPAGRKLGNLVQSGGVQLPGRDAYITVFLLQGDAALQGTEDLKFRLEIGPEAG